MSARCQIVKKISKDVKMPKRCHFVKMMSHVKNSNIWTGGHSQKIDIMKFTNNYVNFNVPYESHQIWSKHIL